MRSFSLFSLIRGPRWAAGTLLVSIFGFQVSIAAASPLDSVLFGVEVPRLGISVFSASGKLRLTQKPVPSATPLGDHEVEVYAHAYFAPSVDPSSRYLAYVDCAGMVLRGNDPQSFQSCSLVERDLNSSVVRKLLDPGSGQFPDSPSWSDDGSSIAMLLGTDVVILSRLTGEVTSRMQAVLGKPSSPVWGANRNYVRYGEGGHTLLVNLTRDCHATDHAWTCPVFGLLDIQDKALHRLDTALGALNLSRGLYLPKRATFDAGGKQVEEATAPPRTANLERLIGDFDHPVYAPVYSADHRYFFYLTFTEGWFSSIWIEGYDRQEHRTFHVTTIQRRLYSE